MKARSTVWLFIKLRHSRECVLLGDLSVITNRSKSAEFSAKVKKKKSSAYLPVVKQHISSHSTSKLQWRNQNFCLSAADEHTVCTPYCRCGEDAYVHMDHDMFSVFLDSPENQNDL